MAISRRDLLTYSAALGAAGILGPSGAGASALSEYRSLDATAMADLVRRGDASPLELLDMAIGRTEEVNPQVNAVVLKHYELARETITRGLPDGPLKGVPFLLKDLGVALKGTVTTDGSRLFKDQVFDYDSTLVERNAVYARRVFHCDSLLLERWRDASIAAQTMEKSDYSGVWISLVYVAPRRFLSRI